MTYSWGSELLLTPMQQNGLKSFELFYLSLEPFLPPLWRRIRTELVAFGHVKGDKFDILDVGGRKSHYTVGVPGCITVTDIIRKSEIQQRLNLGINKAIIDQLRRRRSNLRWVVFDDMTNSSFAAASFDCVVAVEVLEHVERDGKFVSEVHRVLKPGGVFLMTTPNGDYLKNTNPDHKRHYRRAQLETLLKSHFSEVEVEYAIAGGRSRRWAQKSWSLRRPVQTVKSMIGSLVNSWQSAHPQLKYRSEGTHKLIARAIKTN